MSLLIATTLATVDVKNQPKQPHLQVKEKTKYWNKKIKERVQSKNKTSSECKIYFQKSHEQHRNRRSIEDIDHKELKTNFLKWLNGIENIGHKEDEMCEINIEHRHSSIFFLKIKTGEYRRLSVSGDTIVSPRLNITRAIRKGWKGGGRKRVQYKHSHSTSWIPMEKLKNKPETLREIKEWLSLRSGYGHEKDDSLLVRVEHVTSSIFHFTLETESTVRWNFS